MKHRALSIIFAILLCGVLLAQEESGMRSRALFVDKKADGLEIRILKQTRDGLVLVPDNHEFNAGDEFRVGFTSNFKGHVYFINVSPKGETRVLDHYLVQADKENELPAAPYAIKFDDEVGVEILKIVLAREPVPAFDEALRKTKGALGKTASSVAKELAENAGGTNGQQAENVGIVQPESEPGKRCRGLELSLGSKIRCRGIELSHGKAEKNQGTVVVAIPDDPKDLNSDGKLKAGEVTVIEVRLKHL